mmetsp:Transcript_49187/g.73124  ORF Transcript_49187/g.73124 Transcript_49187/m.73124 type:complete len:644 (+) Transcript_49187:204-2135(+)|eukprot:CAMPEP_0195531406 /NCGR_PEP_ID=MMETSP0794_2-20130614/35265_1 /TAXON_ID=515487 /ORGANISM="Stephanopyxis turris, Strain CCMP 815" /LENGTH=643 /DNA_ID=CAMNT_0040663191 /DNA_START=198 /DNA_END=2129 /DNA_ORIENTATION=-
MEMDPFFAVTDATPAPSLNGKGLLNAHPPKAKAEIKNPTSFDAESTPGATSSNDANKFHLHPSGSTGALTSLNAVINSDSNKPVSSGNQPPKDPSFIGSPNAATNPKIATNEDSSAKQEDKVGTKSISNSSGGASGDGPTTKHLQETFSAMSDLFQRKLFDQKHLAVFQDLIRENSQSKDKIGKLKSLLQRSARAQKDTKLELQSCRNKLEDSNRLIAALNARVETLANRPTHYLDLVADFESNFDRALLSIGNTQQSGGEDSSSLPVHAAAADAAYGIDDGYGDYATNTSFDKNDDDASNMASPKMRRKPSTKNKTDAGEDNDSSSQLLVSELNETRSRIEKLESLNSALLNRAAKLETANEETLNEQERAESAINRLKVALRKAKVEAEQANKVVREKTASLAEMQLEIDLVTMASVDANARANESLIAAQSMQGDQKYVQGLEAKVRALTEWALASAEAKKLAVERSKELESKLNILTSSANLEGSALIPSPPVVATRKGSLLSPIKDDAKENNEGKMEEQTERRLWMKMSSKVIGAGDVGSYLVELGTHEIADNEIILLRWKFDVTPSDHEIDFSIVKGQSRDGRDCICNNRTVLGGAGGDVEGAFSVQNACTLVWSNKKSWVRPRTVKFTVEAIAMTV